MTSASPNICPLCGEPNACSLAKTPRIESNKTHELQCWCKGTQIDAQRLQSVGQTAACLCAQCASTGSETPPT